jgi:hypothetical protein
MATASTVCVKPNYKAVVYPKPLNLKFFIRIITFTLIFRLLWCKPALLDSPILTEAVRRAGYFLL